MSPHESLALQQMSPPPLQPPAVKALSSPDSPQSLGHDVHATAMSTSLSLSGEEAAEGPTLQYLDMRIAKLRGIIDWRIDDITRVMQQNEDAWANELEKERRARQESLSAVRQLAETQKLILESGISHERSRIDSLVSGVAGCCCELEHMRECIQNVVATHMTQDLELLEKRLQCEMDTHKATLSHTVSKRLEAIEDISRSRKGGTEESLSHNIKAITVEDVDARIVAFMERYDPRGCEEVFQQAEAMETRDNHGREEMLDQRIRDIVSEALERCESEGRQETLDHRINCTVAEAVSNRSAEFAEKFGMVLSTMKTMRMDINVWEDVLSDYALQGEQRANSIMQDIEELQRSRQVPVLQDGACAEGLGTARMESEIENEKAERKRMQSQFNDLHVMQHNNCHELALLRSQVDSLKQMQQPFQLDEESMQRYRQTSKDAASLLEKTRHQSEEDLRAEVQAKIVAARSLLP
jgi:hypothetical protein